MPIPSYGNKISFFLICALALAQLFCLPGHYLGGEHDDVMYALIARSILRGRYTLGVFPGDPPLTFVTPGWPLLLVPAALVSGDSPAGYEIWTWAWLALCNALVWAWFRRRASFSAAAAMTALFGLNPIVLSRSGVVMSEVPYLAAVLAILLLAESQAPAALVGALLGFAWLIRPAALHAFPAVLGLYAFRGRPRQALACAAAAAAPIVLWTLWVARAGERLAEISELAMTWPSSLGGMLSLAAGNLARAAASWGQAFLPWVWPRGAFGLGALLGAAALWGAGRIWRRSGFEPAAAYLLGGILMHAFWPWWYDRYLVPLAPFLIWGVWECLRDHLALPAWGAALLALFPLGGQWGQLLSGPERNIPELHETYAWISAHTPEQSMFVSAFYARDAFYTGRPFTPLPGAGAASAQAFASALDRRRAGYVLWQDPPDLGSSLGQDFHWSKVLKSLKEGLKPPWFKPLYSNSSEKTVVYARSGFKPPSAIR